jgi:hypothetical protein
VGEATKNTNMYTVAHNLALLPKPSLFSLAFGGSGGGLSGLECLLFVHWQWLGGGRIAVTNGHGVPDGDDLVGINFMESHVLVVAYQKYIPTRQRKD